MKPTEMKKKLKSVKKITFSEHFYEPKVRLRGISEKEVKKHLENPKKLEIVDDQGDEPKGHKYGLLFDKSNKYDLKVVVSFKDEDWINVITTYVQNKKRRKVFEKWLKKLK